MKKLFVLGLILALLLITLPVLAEDGNTTVNGDVSQTNDPTPAPTEAPAADPTVEPMADPTPDPTAAPTEVPTADPTELPTEEPTASPTEEPTAEPTTEQTAEPTTEQTAVPTEQITAVPTPTVVITYAATSLDVPIIVKFKGNVNKGKIDEAITSNRWKECQGPLADPLPGYPGTGR